MTKCGIIKTELMTKYVELKHKDIVFEEVLSYNKIK